MAPTLKEAELRVLLYLTQKATSEGENATRASSREIAESTGCARRNVVRALDALAQRGVIATRQGTATKPSAHMLRFLEVLEMGGVATTPPPRQNSGVEETPEWCRNEPRGGVIATPRTTEPEGLFDLATGVQSIEGLDNTNSFSIDRLLKARPETQNAEDMANARAWVHGYHCKFGRDENPHAPDPQILAQLLTIAPWPALQAMLTDLMHERKEPGYSYAWYVTVALQRIRGIQPGQLKQRRAELRVVKTTQRAEAAEALETKAEFETAIRAAAAGKRL